MDDTPRYTFVGIREELSRLADLLRSNKSPGQKQNERNIEQQIQTLTTHFEKLEEGQNRHMKQIVQCIRQRSVDDYEEKIKDLRDILQDEKAFRLRIEEELKETRLHQRNLHDEITHQRARERKLEETVSKLTKECGDMQKTIAQQNKLVETLRRELFVAGKDKEVTLMKEEDLRKSIVVLDQEMKEDVKKRQCAEDKVRNLERKCQALERELKLYEETNYRQYGTEQRFRSYSVEDMRNVAGTRISPSNSCVTLSEYDFSDNEIVADFAPSTAVKTDIKSLASVGTQDSAFSESSYADQLQELNRKVEKLIRLSKEVPKAESTLLNLPTLIRGFCVNIQELVSSPDRARLRVFSRSLGINLQCVQQRGDYSRDLVSLFWAVILEWYRRCDTATCRATMLNKLIQACCDCHVPNPLDVQPMSTRDRLNIESNYSYLVEHLLVRPALTYFRDCQFLSSSIIRYVTEPELDPEPERIMRFVDILPVCGQHALDHLIKALRKSEQGHIADRIVMTDPERFAGFIEDHHNDRDFQRPIHCQSIEKRKKKKLFDYKHLKEKLFKSKSYKFNND